MAQKSDHDGLYRGQAVPVQGSFAAPTYTPPPGAALEAQNQRLYYLLEELMKQHDEICRRYMRMRGDVPYLMAAMMMCGLVLGIALTRLIYG